MSENVPQDVWTDIFRRLPIKTLLQIMSVCKQWRSVICNPDFVAVHFDHHDKHNDERLISIEHNPGEENFLLLSDGSTLGERKLKLHFPFVNCRRATFSTIGSCNGVICLADVYYACNFTLWNPSIQKYVNLPKPSVNSSFSTFGFGTQFLALGFGFDQKSKDYKVVRVAYMSGRNGRYLIPPEVQVYSLKSNSWRIFHSGAPPYGIYDLSSSPAFVNGAVHWIGYDPCKSNRANTLIVAFDFSDETFREMMLPDELIHAGYGLNIMVYKDSISVYQYNRSKNSGRVRAFSVWVMEVYGVVESWSNLHADIPVGREFDELIALRHNGDVLCRTEGKLANFHPYNYNSRYIDLQFSGKVNTSFAARYAESLVLVDGRSTEKFEEDEDEDEGNLEALHLK